MDGVHTNLYPTICVTEGCRASQVCCTNQALKLPSSFDGTAPQEPLALDLGALSLLSTAVAAERLSLAAAAAAAAASTTKRALPSTNASKILNATTIVLRQKQFPQVAIQ